jgi:hypothetical protein
MIEFIFMLTHHDATIEDALAVYEGTRGTGLRYVGFKDIGVSPDVLAAVTRAAHADGLEVMLEVVSTSVEDELQSLRAAADIGVDWVLGGTHAEEGVGILASGGARYCPFPGIVTEHPSILSGSIDEIADHATRLTAMDGVYGLDLLAYRHVSVDPVALTAAVVEASAGPVIVAGTISSPEQIRAVAGAGAWGYTIGSAIFEGRLPGAPDVAGQIREVLAVGGS